MEEIDLERVAALVREITDELANDAPTSASGLSIEEQIGKFRTWNSAASERLRAALEGVYPGIGWTGETERPQSSDYWLYDPIDGAYHFLQGLPLWSSSLVLVRGGRPVASVVYEPRLGETFTAKERLGASCNGQPLAVSPKVELRAAVVGTAVPPIAQVGLDEVRASLAIAGTLAPKIFVLRPMASASLQLAYVAAGRLDAYVETGNDLADWLAGALLVREAGGVVTDLAGKTLDWAGDGIVAANPALHDAVMSLVGRSGDQA